MSSVDEWFPFRGGTGSSERGNTSFLTFQLAFLFAQAVGAHNVPHTLDVCVSVLFSLNPVYDEHSFYSL